MTLHYLPPTEQVYDSHVPSMYYGTPLVRYFSQRFTYLNENEWEVKINAGEITVNGERSQPGYILQPHDRIVTRMGLRTEPPADRRLQVLYEDDRVRVFNKVAPIPVHPCGRYFKNSMTEILKEKYPAETPRPVQRLDATTTGVLVFAKNRPTAAHLMQRFMESQVRKEYLVLVEGVPQNKNFVIDAPIGKIKGSARGVGPGALRPKTAVTEVQWQSSIGGRSLLKVIPRSGRTNQIRVHLASAGLPVFNDSVYGSEATGAFPESHGLSRFGLHAHFLGFQCFDSYLEIEAPCPAHFQPFLEAI